MRIQLIIGSIFFHCYLFSQDHNILDFGAVADGKTINTKFIQAAVDAAHKDGGGRVLIPAGTFLTGSIILRSDIELYLQKDAVLLGSTDPGDYLKMNWWKAILMADGQQNITVSGAGKIDGQGSILAAHIDSLFYAGKIDSLSYDFVHKRPKEPMRPQLIEFVSCKNVVVKNITLLNASCWVQTYYKCTNVSLDSLTVYSDAYWNNDGIDIMDCHSVRITNCDINSADDGICLKSATPDQHCDSIYISNCRVRSSASALKFGTVSHGGFKNVTINNIQVYDTYRSALAIECVDGGLLENITVNNIHATNTGNAIFIRLGERTKRGDGGQLKNVSIKNMQVQIAAERPDSAYGIPGPALPFAHNIFPSSITGIPGHAVENVTLENIEILYPGKGDTSVAHMPLTQLHNVAEKIADYPEYSMFGELPAWGFYVRHVNGLTMKNIKLQIQAADYRPAIIFDDVKNSVLNSIVISGDEKKEQIILYNIQDIQLDNEQNVRRL